MQSFTSIVQILSIVWLGQPQKPVPSPTPPQPELTERDRLQAVFNGLLKSSEFVTLWNRANLNLDEPIKIFPSIDSQAQVERSKYIKRPGLKFEIYVNSKKPRRDDEIARSIIYELCNVWLYPEQRKHFKAIRVGGYGPRVAAAKQAFAKAMIQTEWNALRKTEEYTKVIAFYNFAPCKLPDFDTYFLDQIATGRTRKFDDTFDWHYARRRSISG